MHDDNDNDGRMPTRIFTVKFGYKVSNFLEIVVIMASNLREYGPEVAMERFRIPLWRLGLFLRQRGIKIHKTTLLRMIHKSTAKEGVDFVLGFVQFRDATTGYQFGKGAACMLLCQELAAALVRQVVQWDESEVSAEVERLIAEIEREHSVR